jgi:ABC-2 type transport system ATP-binding protein
VLLLDEPTNGVDPLSRREFWRILYQLLREKVTILITTAYLDEAERCNRVGLMHKGKLVACGTPQEVKRLMRGEILEIRATEPRKAIALLRAGVTADALGLFGDRIHLVTRNIEQSAAEAQRALRGAGFAVTSVRTIEPTLEDVFVSVMAEESPDGERRAD